MSWARLVTMLIMLIALNSLNVGTLLAATYSVKASGGGNYTTIQACANAAVAGDTCTVFAGTYAGWTQSTSGSSGSPITFTVNPGDSVTVTSQVTVTNTSFITINGFKFTVTSGRAVFAVDGPSITTSDIIVSNNTVTATQPNTLDVFYLYGDRIRIENNDASGFGNDFVDVGGQNVVIRGNTFRNADGGASGGAEHIDFVQVVGGGTTPTLSFSLIEQNVEQSCTNDAGNCHFVIIRTGSGPVANSNIVRFNYAQNLDGSALSFGGVGDNVPNTHAYNNTFATMKLVAENADCGSLQNAPNGVFLNNICYNVQTGGYFPFSGSAPPNNGNLVFTTGYSGSWPAPFSQEATYTTFRNKDPLFANFPTDGTLQVSSPAIAAGVPLTTVAAGDSGSGTSLVVGDARYFQPGWAGAQADWLRVGPTITVQIVSINYTTNTITLASPISRSVGDRIYLYKDSSGRVVLYGSAPDTGAYPFQGSRPASPTNLRVQ